MEKRIISESQLKKIVAESVRRVLTNESFMDTLKNGASKVNDKVGNFINSRVNIQAPEEFKNLVKSYDCTVHKQMPDGGIRIYGANISKLIPAIKSKFKDASFKNDGDNYSRIVYLGTQESMNLLQN